MTTIIDSKGRILTIRELDALDEARLVRIVGGEAAINPLYLRGYVLPAASVARIDGDEYPIPFTQREVENAIQRIHKSDFGKIMAVIYPKDDGEDEAVKNS